MSGNDGRLPPHVPWRTFETYIEGLKAFGAYLPSVIDRNSMRTLSGVTQTRLLDALQTLKLIDEHGSVRPRLTQIVEATADQRKSLFQQIIVSEYTFLRGLNLQDSTPTQLETAFKSAGAGGDTVRQCIAFFVGMVKAADIPISQAMTKARGRHARNGTRETRSREVHQTMRAETAHLPARDHGNAGTTTAKPTYQILYELLDSDMDKNEQEAVWTLLQYVRRKDAAR